MKIRTDFVTNSSSSSYVVDILLKDLDGKEYSVKIPPEDPDAYCQGNMKCSAESIASVSSIDELVDILINSADSGDEFDEEEYKWACEEYGEELDWFRPDLLTQEAMEKFGKKIKNEISNINQIKSIEFKRTWVAWGEGASCFGLNLETDAPELPELARRVCETEGEEKENARKSLEQYLANYSGLIYGGWCGKFPSGFMGSKGNASIVWNKYVDTIDKLAEKAVKGELPLDDLAEETVVIDMQTRKIENKAEYVLGGLQ